MEIGRVDSSVLPPLPPVNSLPVATPRSGATADQVGGTLQDLSASQVGQLLNLLDHRQEPAALDSLMKSAVAAVHAHRLPDAVKTLQQLIVTSPEHGPHMVRNDAGLQPIQHDLKEMLHRLTMGAKVDAERMLTLAQITMQTSPSRIVEPSGIPAQDLMGIARRFYESGDYLNYIRATQIGGMVLAQRPKGAERMASMSWLAVWWKRAPLLVLLVGWLGVGVLVWVVGGGGSGAVEVWVTAFLALVLFQFFWSVRNFR